MACRPRYRSYTPLNLLYVIVYMLTSLYREQNTTARLWNSHILYDDKDIHPIAPTPTLRRGPNRLFPRNSERSGAPQSSVPFRSHLLPAHLICPSQLTHYQNRSQGTRDPPGRVRCPTRRLLMAFGIPFGYLPYVFCTFFKKKRIKGVNCLLHKADKSEFSWFFFSTGAWRTLGISRPCRRVGWTGLGWRDAGEEMVV